MRDDYTPAVTRALQLSDAWARYTGEQAVLPSHLLQALLQEEDGRAWALLLETGIDPSRVRIAAPTTPPGARFSDEPVPCDAATKQVLATARELARDYGPERTVASEHLLLALLQEDSSLRQSLEAHGLNLLQLEAAVLSERGPSLALDEPLELDDATDQIEVARVLDACANRAREALRVVEDYCRFVLDDAFLSRELKQLRHELTDAVGSFPRQHLLTARETLRDVGTAITTDQERERDSPTDVVLANWKRLQEALRSLEEFGKLYEPGLGQKMEALRYRIYTLERAAGLGDDARVRLDAARLCVLLTSARCRHSLSHTIREAAAGGAGIFQLREKSLADAELLKRAREVRRLTREVGALFIMNDRPDVARLSQADGVHLGQDDLSVKDARRILGPDSLIGVSTHHLDQVRQALLDGASYLGVGPTFPSATKSFAEFPGLEFVKQAMAETTLPVFVIGGVTLDTLDAAIAAGARRVAVSQAICGAENPRDVAREMCRKLG